MVSVGQLVGMILAIVVPVMIQIVLFLHAKKELKVKGLPVAACYGLLGYLWEAWIYVMAYGWVGAMMMQNTWFDSGFGIVVKQMIIALVYALLTTGGLCWAVYLSNMREPLVERGPAVGIGFGLSYAVWNYVLVYGAPLIIGFRMRFGGYEGTQEMQDKVLSLSVENMYLFILDTVIFSLIVMATTLLMSNHQQNGRPLYMFLIPFVSQFMIKFLDTLLPTLMPEIVSSVIYHVLMGTAALWSLWVVLNYLKTRKINHLLKSTQ
ncbi:MAG: hypothetical protein J5819_10650 [Eubacterium sp.]|nr:hypothetical protein [Eubacterium sp.]